MKVEDFTKIVAPLFLEFGEMINKEAVKGWFHVLKAQKITSNEFSQAVANYIAFGTPYGQVRLSDILKAGGIQPKKIAEPDSSVKGRTQAHAILDHIHRYGANASLPDNIDAVSRRLLQGRWSMRALGENLIEAEEQWFVKEFIEAYKAESEMQQYHDNEQIEYDKKLKPLLENIGITV
jgi:hypothetical protein